MTFSVSQLSLKKSATTILDSMSLRIPKNKFTAIMGPNGAGKSSLLRCLVQAETDYEGQVNLADRNILNLSATERSRLISWVPEDTNIPFAFTAIEIVLLGRFGHHQGHPSSSDRHLALQALEQVGLRDKKSQEITSMSSGERRKVMIARAICSECPTLLLDEPIANLDVLAILETMTLLKTLSLEGMTIIISLHDLSLAKRFCDHAVVLCDSQLAASGPTSTTLTSDLIASIFKVRAEIYKSQTGDEGLFVDLN